MAFERDFVERFGEDGRNELITYRKALKQANLNMIPVIATLMTTTRPGDQRFAQHFKHLAQHEEHHCMSLISPPDRADHEIMNVPPQIAAMAYGAYKAFNIAKTDSLRPTAPPEVIEHCVHLTQVLENLENAAKESTTRVALPIALLNMGYEAVLMEANPHAFDKVPGAAH